MVESLVLLGSSKMSILMLQDIAVIWVADWGLKERLKFLACLTPQGSEGAEEERCTLVGLVKVSDFVFFFEDLQSLG